MIIRTPFKSAKKKPSAKTRALQASWKKLIVDTVPKNPVVSKKDTSLKCAYNIPPGRSTDHIPSISTNKHSTALKDSVMYTGENVIGITILHKSCLQPVFSKQEAVEASQMRRG